ncbi:MAG: ABC transporter substrate-binding protein [Treponema sp.]|nr:ABC transporter substrate-binding protein [Treponema sp.]
MNNKNRFCITIVFHLLVFSCSEKLPAAGNGIGTGVNIDHPPVISRIISAAPSITEIIAGLGLADKLVATDRYSRNLEGVRKELPEIDFFYPNIEAIAGLNPDIIITGEINAQGADNTGFDFFRQLGITVIQIPTSNSIEDIYTDIIRIAEALGVPDRGTELVLQMQYTITKVSLLAAQRNTELYETSQTHKPCVYFEIAPAPNIVSFGYGTYLNELIEICGAQNIFSGEKRWFTPGAEAIVSANPDVIFIMEGVSDTEEIKNRPGFRSINAIRQNRVYAINTDYASRPSQNIVLALEKMYNAMWQEQQ